MTPDTTETYWYIPQHGILQCSMNPATMGQHWTRYMKKWTLEPADVPGSTISDLLQLSQRLKQYVQLTVGPGGSWSVLSLGASKLVVNILEDFIGEFLDFESRWACLELSLNLMSNLTVKWIISMLGSGPTASAAAMQLAMPSIRVSNNKHAKRFRQHQKCTLKQVLSEGGFTQAYYLCH